MALNVGDIRTRITAKDETKAAFASASRNIGTLKSSVTGLSSQFAKLSGAIAGIAGVAALTQLTKEGLEYADALGKASDKLGVMTVELQALRRAAEFAGISTSGLEKSMKEIAKRTAEAVDNGVGPAADALKTLGINAEQLNQKNPAQQIEEVLAALGELENQNDKIFLSNELFGRGGLDLLLLTGDAIRTAADEVERYGLSLSRVDVAGIEAANDAMARLSLQAQGVGQQFAAGIAPAVEATAIAMLQASGAASDWASAGATAGTIWTDSLVFVIDLYNTLRVLIRETQAIAIEGSIAIAQASLAVNGFLGNDTTAQQRSILETKRNLAEFRSETAQIQIDGSFADDMNAALEQVRLNAEAAAAKIETFKNKTGDVASILGDTTNKITSNASNTKTIERELQRIITANLSPFEKAAADFAKAQSTIDQALAANISTQFDESTLRAKNYATLVTGIADEITTKLNLGQVKTGEQLGAAEAQGMLALSVAIDQANLSQQAQLDVTNQVVAALNQQREQVALLAEQEAAATAAKAQQETFNAVTGDSSTFAITQELARQSEITNAVAQGWISRVTLSEDYQAILEEQAAAHQSRLLSLYEQGGKKLVDFEKLSGKQKKNIVIGDLRDITSALATENRAAFEINRAFALSDVAQTSIQAVMKAYKWGATFGGPLGGAAAAAPAAIFGALQVQAILKQGFGQGADSATASGGGGAAAGTPASTDTVSNVQSGSGTAGGPVIQNHIHINSITADQAAVGYLQGKQAARELNMEQGGSTDLILTDQSGLLNGAY